MDDSASVADLLTKWQQDLAQLNTCIQSGDQVRAGALAAELARYQVRITSKQQEPLFPPGTAVMYLSTSQNEWIPAVVEGTDECKQIYRLDCHPEAPVDRVRLPPQQQQCVVPSNTHTPSFHNAVIMPPRHGRPPQLAARPIQTLYRVSPTMASKETEAACVNLPSGAPPQQVSLNHQHIGAPTFPNSTPYHQTSVPFSQGPGSRAPLQIIPKKVASAQSNSYLANATPASSSSSLPQAVLASGPDMVASRMVVQQRQRQHSVVSNGCEPNHTHDTDEGQHAAEPQRNRGDNQQHGGQHPIVREPSQTEHHEGGQRPILAMNGQSDFQNALTRSVSSRAPPDTQKAEQPLIPQNGPPIVQHAQQGGLPMNGPPDTVADLCTLSAEQFAPACSSNPFAPNLLNPFLQETLNIHARVHRLAATSTPDDQMSEDEKLARQLQQDLNFPSETSSSASNYLRQCFVCHTRIAIVDAFTLDCEHTCCPKCLRDHVVNDGRAVETVGCPCGHPLTPAQLKAVLGDELEDIYAARLDSALREIELEEEEHVVVPRQYRCPLCFDEVLLDEMVSLECDHKLCAECFGNYLKTKVTDGEVANDELVCPLPDCKLELSLIIIEAHVTPAIWDRFLSFRMKMFRPESGDLVQCPTPSCSTFIAPLGLKKVACPTCHKEFCPSCNEDPHVDVTCEEFRQWKRENDVGDKKFEQLIEDEQWKRCPKCGFACERSEGCNFMQCVSATCRRKTYFCYICGDELRKDLHYAHFPEGPYRMKCDTMPNGPAVKMPPKAPAQRDPEHLRPEGNGNPFRADFNRPQELLYQFQNWFANRDPEQAQ